MLEALFLFEKKKSSKKTWASWCGGADFCLCSAEHRVDSLGTIVIVCVLDSCHVGSFFVCFFDRLRDGQKDDEEVFSETCQCSGVFPQVGQLFVPRRVARLEENATTLTCFAQQIAEAWTRVKFEGGEKREEVEEEERGRTQLLRSKTPSSEKSKR